MAFDVSYIYRIKDQYSASMRKIAGSTKKFEAQIKKTRVSLKKLENQTDKNKKKAKDMHASLGALAGTTGLTLAVKGMIDTASSFEQAMNSVQAKTSATSREMAAMRKQARLLGETTQFSATQAAQGMVFLGMAGLKTNNILKSMPGVLDLAASSELDLASAADITTNVLSQFGMQVGDIGRVNDVLAVAAANANTSVLQMAEALKNTGALANLAGMNIEQVVSALMLLSSADVKGGEAGTQLMNVFRELSTGGPKVRKLFRSLGLDMKRFIDKNTGEVKDFAGLIEAFGKTGPRAAMGLKRFTKSFDVRAAKGMAVLAKKGGDEFRKMEDMLNNASGASERMSKIMMQGLPGAQKRLKSATESLSLSFTATFLPALSEAMESLSKFFAHMASNHPTVLKVAAALTMFAIALGLVATAALVLAPVIAAISLKMVLITGVIMGVVVGLKWLVNWLNESGVWKAFSEWVSGAWESLKKFVTELHFFKFIAGVLGIVWMLFKKLAGVLFDLAKFVGSVFWEAFKGVFLFIGNTLKFIIKLADNLFGILGDILNFEFAEAWESMKDTAVEAFGGIVDILETVWDMFKNIGKEIRDLFAYIFTFGETQRDKKINIGGPSITEEDIRNYAAAQKDPFIITKYSGGGGGNQLDISGNIRVSADQGSRVKSAKIYTKNNGMNLAESAGF